MLARHKIKHCRTSIKYYPVYNKEKIFFNEKLKLEFEYFENEITPRYGNQHQRLMGGLSSKAIKELCNENGIEYTEGEENNA